MSAALTQRSGQHPIPLLHTSHITKSALPTLHSGQRQSSGTSAQRVRWFTKGLRGGDPADGDTFSVPYEQL